ncbi:DUF2163 domain-containing protein [Pacificimonas flava]|uniref:FAD/FMN-containing dehydrogenase n=1 Tax=Pacificimonas flava TaxID=1234595 RepID=M2U396_9SPHN|nr:DUF2163 domain-containing protein [Pacificimonas flava]EMD82487.1 FAD/FMN-containing dehydrogenase [Pacificimonas flava]MBB5281319.1 putative phage protein (TIGR02218 family) [Pacificimonas flava]
MRRVSEALQASLNGELTSLSYLWRIDRPDGIALGLTTHDRAIWFDGLRYEPGPGIRPSAIAEEEGGTAPGAEIAGVLSHACISSSDLDAGRYDGARVELHLIDWTRPQAGGVLLMRGELGAVVAEGHAFSADLLTSAAALDRIPVELTSPECRAALGDRRCQVDLTRHRLRAAVASVMAGEEIAVDRELPAGDFTYGTALVVSGALAGVRLGISRAQGSRILFERSAATLSVGDRLLLTEGCDRRFSTCRERFGNALNFRGESHVPGQDSVMRYPGL